MNVSFQSELRILGNKDETGILKSAMEKIVSSMVTLTSEKPYDKTSVGFVNTSKPKKIKKGLVLDEDEAAIIKYISTELGNKH